MGLKSERQVKLQRLYVRMTYARRIKQKLCARCGKTKPPRPAKAHCDTCIDYIKARNKLRKVGYGSQPIGFM